MNDVMKNVTKILFWILALAVILWTSSLTVSLASRLFPGDDITPYFVLALYDGGALVWLLVFLKNAKGLPQRAVALLAFMLDVLGVMIASFSELFLGGQNLTAIPEGLGEAVVWIVGISTIINLVAIYGYHITNPDELLEIKLQTMEDNVQGEALRQVEAQVTEQAALLAESIKARMYVNVLSRLALPVPEAHRTMTPNAGNVIDITPADSGNAPAGSATTGTATTPEPNPTQARKRS